MSKEAPNIMAFQELLMAFGEVTGDFMVPTADDKRGGGGRAEGPGKLIKFWASNWIQGEENHTPQGTGTKIL